MTFGGAGRPWILLAVATLVPRIALALILGVVGSPERWEYDVIAANIVRGEGHVYDRLGFIYAAYAPPLWSYLLAGLALLPGESRIGIQIFQALLCLGTSIVACALARRITGDARAGLLAGLFVALQPSLVYYSVMKSDPLPLSALLLCLIASAGVSVLDSPRRLPALGFGVLVGLGVLSRGTPAVALPLFAVAMLIRWRKAAVRPIAIATLGCALCLTPWLARNAAVVGTPLITSTTGENFWRGNHHGASGGVHDADGGRITYLVAENKALPDTVRAILPLGTELERHRVFMDEAWAFIAEQPGAALRLFARKMRTFWWRIESDSRDYPAAVAFAYEWLYRTELFAAILGAFLVLRPKERDAAVFALSLMIAISLLQSAFYVQGRHRFLIEPLLLLFTARGVTFLFDVVGLNRHRPGG